MKKLLLCLCIFISIRSYAQQPFAPPGAVWHYDYNGVASGGFVKIEYHTDSLIQGITCKKLDLDLYSWFLTGPGTYGFALIHLAPQFIYQNADTVFWYTQHQFRELYNFNKLPGEVWLVTDSGFSSTNGCDTLSYFYVDSVSTENISAENLRYLSGHPAGNSPSGFYGRIYERLGSMQYLFPEYTHCDTTVIVDNPFYRFHCYEDSSFGFYNADTSDCELYWWILNAGQELDKDKIFNAYPNPTADELFINCNYEIKSIAVWNIHGVKILERNINSWIRNYRIDVSSLTQGLYMVSAVTKAGQLTRRFIKQ